MVQIFYRYPMLVHEKKKIDIKLITSFMLNKMIKDLYHSGPAGTPLEPGTVSHYLRGIRALYNKANSIIITKTLIL